VVGSTPYYEEHGIAIYHGDCRDFLPSMGGVVLTDPPYGNGTQYLSFPDDGSSLRELVAGVMPLILNMERAFISCGVSNIHLYQKPDWTLAWFTPAGAGSGPWGFCCWQPILAYGKDPYLQNGSGRRPDAIVATESSENNGHPCPKPIGVWKWLLKRLSPNDSETIIDPFMGSGTTLRAAKDLGRTAIGIEIEERYCEIAAKRLSQ
jgi:site-specific DNA-methyltransferase (adenine-specific)